MSHDYKDIFIMLDNGTTTCHLSPDNFCHQTSKEDFEHVENEENNCAKVKFLATIDR